MGASSALHPAAGVLKAFASGRLDDAAAETVMSHLDGCPDCCRAVAASSGDDFLARLRQARGRSGTPAPAQTLSQAARPAPPAASQTAIPNLPPQLASDSQYEVLRELGRGGMGVVYLARNKLMDRVEVLKVVNKALLDRPGAVERFLREIRSAAKLAHPNVVAAYSALQLGEVLAFAMEYVEGEDLASLVKSRGPLPVATACFYVQQAALGLQHAHEKGMVHRDIKPQNLMLARQGKKHVVKVLDFGLAKATRDDSEDTGLTGEGKMLGTPDYIAPEQTLDATHADIRADVYSLGCTLYYLLTGGPPFKGKSLYEVLQAHHSMDARPLNLVRPEAPEELAAVVRKMMAKDPAKRYQTPLEVVKALSPFVGQGAKGAPPKSAPELSVGAATVKPDGPTAPAAKGAREKAPAPPAVARETMMEASLTSTRAPKGAAARKRRQPAAKPTPWKMWLIGGGVAVGVLLLALLGMLAAGVFKVKTADGILVVQVNEPNAEVFVDGDRMTVSWDDGGKTAEVHVKPGTRKVEVRKDGFGADAKELTFTDGGREIFTAQLLPAQAGKADAQPPNPRPADAPAPAAPRSDYDDLAKGRWVAVLPSIEEFDRLRTEKAFNVAAKPNPGAEPTFVNGVLQCNNSRMFFPPIQAKDAIVRAWVTKAGLKLYGNVGLILRRDDDGQVAAFFNGGGYFGIGRSTNHVWKDLQTCRFSEQYDGEFEFAFAAIGDRLIAYANGRKILEARDEAPVDRPAGIGVGTAIGLGTFRDIEVQILDKPPAESAVPPAPAADDAWLKQVAALPVDKQADAVAAKLKELNPGFDGKIECKVEGGQVVSLQFLTVSVKNISPVRALPELRVLVCGGNYWARNGQLADLTPLKGMKLTALDCHDTQVADLAPLRGMPLTALNCSSTLVSDLSPLKDIKLTSLNCLGAPILDLSPLKDMNLTCLNCGNTRVSDLSPLKDMNLTELHLAGTQVSNLSPLKDMKLTDLDCNNTQVSDLSPLKDMKLTGLHLAGTQVSNLSPLKDMKLTGLDCNNTQVSDLSPLKDMNLTTLFCENTQVSDLSPLKDMNLTILNCSRTRVSDLSPLKGMLLKEVWCDFRPERDAEILRSIKTLETINGKPAAQFWKEFPPAKPDGQGFVPLFNGKDLTGWKTHPSQPGNWRVENGILTASSDGISHLYTDRGDFTDFHLRLEARINDGGKTGVYFRAPFGPNLPADKPTWPSGYNAKMDARRLGGLLIDLNPGLHRTREPVLRPGEWTTFEVIAQGNHVVIKVNGETTSDYTDEQRLYTKGRIVLQQHGAQTVAEFRKIEIKELTAAKPLPAPEQPAPAPAADDPIRDKLEQARSDYDAAVEKYQKRVHDGLDAAEEAARGAGEKDRVDKIKADRDAFNANGDLPKSIPTRDYKLDLDVARASMDAAYASAIAAYTKANRDDKAAALTEERKLFQEAHSTDVFQAGSVWVNDEKGYKFTVIERKGERFRARFLVGEFGDREINGTVKGRKVSWLAKDVRPIRGGPGADNQGTLTRDKDGDLINLVWRSDKGDRSGAFTLRLKAGK